ncbi:7tm 6 domain containing protein [Asbolus verrucosus]|uniref:7tm 6 domain containing protein n=1 Tax=Asbolus verrucosus TaxID=1661398 RepID=A0A482W3E0_ASBVE|nr:7tm 6 domain containing protein [Asbolus verrucosus]
MGMVKQLMKTLNSDLFQPKTAKQIILVKPSLEFCNITYKILTFMAVGTAFFWSIFPILDDSYKDYRLPIPAWYPYNTKTPPFYEITYVYQVLGTYFMALTNVCIDTLIASLNMYVGTQIDILCDDLRNLDDPDEEGISKKLTACIKHHKGILSFAGNSNEFVKWIFFLQFFILKTAWSYFALLHHITSRN